MKRHDFVSFSLKRKQQLPKVRKTKTKHRLVWRIIAGLIILLLMCLALLRYRSVINTSVWDGKHNLSMALAVGPDIYAVSYQPVDRQAVVLYIPGKTYLNLVKGYGAYPASSVWQLGQLEQFGGGQLLQLSVQNFLGVPIQGWGYLHDSPFKNKDNLVTSKKDIELLAFKLFTSGKTNMTVWDLSRLIYGIRSLPPGKISSYSLAETRAGEEIRLPDGDTVFGVRQEFLDNIVRSTFKDNQILSENLVFAVINKTDSLGLSADAARIINNIGGEVALYADKPEAYSDGIYCSNADDCRSYSVRLFSRTFRLPVISEKIEESRAEVVVVLGDNYRKYFYER